MSVAIQQRLVLDFHGLGSKPSHVGPEEAYYWCEDIGFFERILDAIPEVSARSGTPIEITFDDGNASDVVHGLPALTERHLPASFFVCAGRIGQSGYLDKKAMTEIVSAGMTIGSHGWSHIDWRRADQQTLAKEVNDAKRAIEDVIGRQVDAVAIPFGSYDRRVLRSLSAFSTVYTSDSCLAPLRSRLVPRVSYDKDWRETSLSELASHRDGWLAATKRSAKLAIKRLR